MTHDLITDLIAELDAEVTRITVTELRENTFYARITLERNGSEIEIDSDRPTRSRSRCGSRRRSSPPTR